MGKNLRRDGFAREWPVRVMTFLPARPPRNRGAPKKAISIKVSEPVTSYVDALTKRGYGLTEVMMAISVAGVDVLSGTESARHLVEHVAQQRGVRASEAIAQLCMERLSEIFPEMMRGKPG